MLYRLLGLTIALFWAAMMTLLVRRDVLPELDPLPTAGYQAFLETVDEAPRVERLGIWFAGKRLGHTQTTYTRKPGGGYLIAREVRFSLSRGLDMGAALGRPLPGAGDPAGGVLDMAMTMTAQVDKDFQLRSFDIELLMGGVRQRVLGHLRGGTMDVTRVVGQEQTRETLPFDSRTVMGGLMAPAEYAGKLRLGHGWEVRFIDPLTGKPKALRREVVAQEPITVGGRRYEVFKIESRLGKTLSTVYVDADGRVIREQHPYGLRMDIEQPEGAPK